MSFQRARTEENKKIRRQEILDATTELFDEIGYEKITFTKIAEKLSFNRINLYNYFGNKNDIFLEILLQEIASMVQDAKETFVTSCPEDVFIEKWGELMLRHQRMMTLFSITNTVFLKGASSLLHKAYRTQLHHLFQELYPIIHVALPGLSKEQIWQFIELENSYSMTLYPASIEYKKSQNIEIFQDAGFGTRKFLPQFTSYLGIILKGIESR